MTSLAEKVFPTSERLEAYAHYQCELIPGWKKQYFRAKAQMEKAIPAASDPNGSLKDLATFIIAARACENAQVSLLSAEKIARDTHPMSKSGWGK